ncbi:helix-turn-helix domain-containing protein [Listeria monocytogenes]|uniref:helix-turn-helix domain-containing protein n=1 Tax=Listeria TaxID=1637 RepID=UPI000E72010E|nr:MULTISPECIES: helix-turn-helix domain-containing protein [Listeria]EAE6190762.1 helix-turn-helix domain-containing protein [Listeria monocytogenes]EAK8992424.1 helix-turn-helix domain-containing protein [Listeria monocytogenes]EAK8995613.1 helix-turn-helix domain-containing protein [Listeria monocytogenes]EBF5351322.1 helix-turn-helix domain-containing protein [Listeria monocytogenes]EBF6148468.1 helix-turn-helix domain-containing protein [Listeria monocytogenes]
MPVQKLKELVKIALIRRGISQAELAKTIGISPTYLSDILNDNRSGKKVDDIKNQITKLLEIDKEV